jgi:hypothetical protein
MNGIREIRDAIAGCSWCLSLVLAGCAGTPIPAPPNISPVAAATPAPESTIMMPISVDADALRAAIESSIKSRPLAQGQTSSFNVISKTIYNPRLRRNQVAFGTASTLRYLVAVNSFPWSISGNTISIAPEVNVKLDLDTTVTVFDKTTTKLDVAHCDLTFTPQATASLQLAQEGEDVRPQIDVQSLGLNIEKLCLPAAAKALDKAVSLPVVALVVDQLRSSLEVKLRDSLNRELAAGLDKLDVGDRIRTAAETVRAPIGIAPNVWLVANADRLLVSQIVGADQDGRSMLSTTVGLQARPEIIYGEPPVTPPGPPLAISLGAGGDQFELRPRGVISLDLASKPLTAELAKIIAATPKYRNVVVAEVTLYQSNDKIVAAILLKNLGLFGSQATIYLSGTPEFDPAQQQISLAGLTLDVASRNFLARSAAWLQDAQIERRLTAAAHYSLAPKLDEAVKALANFSTTTKAGVLSGSLNSITLTDFGVSNGDLAFTLRLQGSSRFQLNAP